MSTRSKIRRTLLVCAGAVAALSLSAGAAVAQSAEDCDELEGIPGIGEQLADGCRDFADAVEGDDDNGDDNGDDGPTGTPLDELLAALEEQGLDPDELCALRDEAPEEFDAVLDALGPVVNELCPPEEEEEEDETESTPETGDPADGTADPEEADTTDADSSGELPQTGGFAGLAGLGLLGGAVALWRRRAADGS